MPKAPALLPEGLRDRLPQQAEAASRVTRALVDAMRAHGYGRVSPPLAEFRETLGGDDDRSSRDLLRFTDPVSQRTLALRPDITRQVGRIATSLLAHAPRPLRLCYAGQVVKLRASQLRPAREMLQVGAELIGSDSVAAAREIVTVAIDALDAAGIGPVTIDFTLPDAVDLLAASLPVAASLDTLRDELDAKDAGALVRIGAAAYLPLLRATGPFDQAIADLRAFDTGGVLTSRIDALEAIAAPVRDRVSLTLDPTERHGFAYQSWFGFQIFVPGQGDAIGRGGGYAIPVGEDHEESAVGFSLYPDPLIDDGLGTEDDAERRLFLPLGHDAALAAGLRADGWQTVAALSDGDDARALGCGYRLSADGPVEA